jgi:hypothetical protein
VVDVVPEPAAGRLARRRVGSVPDLERLEVRAIRIRVAAAVDDRESAVVEQLFERLHRVVQREPVVERVEAVGQADRGARLEVRVVADGNHSVEPVVAAGELDDDEDVVVADRRAGDGVAVEGEL